VVPPAEYQETLVSNAGSAIVSDVFGMRRRAKGGGLRTFQNKNFRNGKKRRTNKFKREVEPLRARRSLKKGGLYFFLRSRSSFAWRHGLNAWPSRFPSCQLLHMPFE